MISADTSVIIAYFQGQEGDDVTLLEKALLNRELILSPVVISELLSDPKLSNAVIKDIISMPTLETIDGYWQRSGFTRAKLLAKKLKARLADTLIAQSCIDHNLSLIARDGDFRHFQKHCNLKLIQF
jgi:hypothetical protein